MKLFGRLLEFMHNKEKFLLEKKGLYYFIRIIFAFLLELWENYALYPMFVYCFLRLSLFVTFNLKVEFLYFFIFMTVGIFVCFKYHFQDRLIAVLYKLLVFGYGQAVVQPAVYFDRGRGIDGENNTGEMSFGFAFNKLLWAEYEDKNERSLVRRILISVFTFVHLRLVKLAYIYLVEYYLFILIYLSIVYICIIMKWFYFVYFISLIYNLMRFVCMFATFPKRKDWVRQVWAHTKGATGYITPIGGGYVYFLFRIVGSLNVMSKMRAIVSVHNDLTDKERIELPKHFHVGWMLFLMQIGLISTEFLKYKCFNMDNAGEEPPLWEYDYYGDKIYARYLVWLVSIVWFIYLIYSLLFV